MLRDAGVSCNYGIPPGDHARLGDAAPLMSHALIESFVADERLGAETEAGVVLSISPASRGDLGLVVTPFGSIAAKRSAGPWIIDLKLTAGVDAIAYETPGSTLWPARVRPR